MCVCVVHMCVCIGCPWRDSNLVDNRSGNCLLPTGGRLRECPQRLLQETGQTQLPVHPTQVSVTSLSFLSRSCQVTQLNTLINLLLGDLSKGDRQRIMTICTIDVHARDVVAKMILQKTENAQSFLWLSQLRHRFEALITWLKPLVT